jgi:formamidopyrimidine-DNA glycosylase
VPELPDVEGFRRVLAEHGSGRRVEETEVPDPSVLRNATPEVVARALRGHRFEEPERHGKWLLAHIEGGIVLFHFGMSGELRWAQIGAERHRHDRVVVRLEDGELRYRDQRKLQGVWLARDAEEAAAITGPLGPDALGLSSRQLRERLGGRRGELKAALMDQEVIAGLGNILVDEILWQARIHPRRHVHDLCDREWDRLYRSLRRVVRQSVRAGRVPPRPSWLTGVRDQDAPSCPRCGAALVRDRVAGRSSWSCPRCQPSLLS